jgi:hypothetical protein
MQINVVSKKVNVGEVELGNYIHSYNIDSNTNVFNRVNEIITNDIVSTEQAKITLSNNDELIVSINTRLFVNYGDGWHYEYVQNLISSEKKFNMLTSDDTLVGITNIEVGEEFAPTNFIDFNIENDHNFYVKRPNDIAFKLIHNSGACTVALDSWHMDIEDFLELQTENGDQRMKAFDIFPQVVLSDEFMRRVESGKLWTLVDPFEIKTKLGVDIAESWGEKFEEVYSIIEKMVDDLGKKHGVDLTCLHDDAFENAYKTLIKGKNDVADTQCLKMIKRISAKELFKTIMKTQVETGMPYLTFKDAMNRANPNKHDGMIGNGNLCQESYSNFRPSTVSETQIEQADGGYKIIRETNAGLVHTCLTGETLIHVKVDGLEHEMSLESVISLLEKGTAVLVKSFNHDTCEIEYRKIENGALMKKEANLIKITSEQGQSIECTPEHRIWTENRGYVMAKDLLETDVLLLR